MWSHTVAKVMEGQERIHQLNTDDQDARSERATTGNFSQDMGVPPLLCHKMPKDPL